MKILGVLLLILAGGFLQAEESYEVRYAHAEELGQGYDFRNEKLTIDPYQYFPVWFRGTRTEKRIELRPGDHFSYLSEGYYQEYRFDGWTGKHLAFTHRTFSYSLGPEENRRKRIIQGKLLKTATFRLPPEGPCVLIDYANYLESKIGQDRWKTR